MSSTLVGDRWYLSSFSKWNDKKQYIFWAHLPTLISNALSMHENPTTIWHKLSMTSSHQSTLLALQGHLLLVGGSQKCDKKIQRYDPKTKQLLECGQLPVEMITPCSCVLPHSQIMVAGGITDSPTYSKRAWTGNTTIHVITAEECS